MKITTKIFFPIVLVLSSLFASNAIINVKKAEFANKTIQNGKVNLSVESSSDIKGIQFNIIYNQQELSLLETGIVSKISGIEVYCRVSQEGMAKVLMFSMSGDKILDINSDNVADIIEINFDPVNMFNGTSKVELADIIIAGKSGEQIPAAERAVFDVSYFAPQKTSLSENYPNPFNPSTTIDYQLSNAGTVSIIVYDLKGSEVKTLVEEYQEAAYHNVVWNGMNNNSQSVASGRYLLKMTAPDYTETITMTLLK